MSKNFLLRSIDFSVKALRHAACYLDRVAYAHRVHDAYIHPSSLVAYRKLRMKEGCSLHIDENSQVEGSLIFDKQGASIRIGKRTFMSGQIIAADHVSLGDDILISWGVTIVDHNSHSLAFSKRAQDVLRWRNGIKDWSTVEMGPVTIGNKVWVGFNSIVLCGVAIGEGAVIGAGSVVTRDIPAWTVAAGNPARVIKDIPIHDR